VALRAVIVVLAVGFVPAMVFSWVFETDAGGIEARERCRAQRIDQPHTGRKLDRTIMIVLALALGYFAFDKFALAPRRDAALVATTTESVRANAAKIGAGSPTADEKSIAVLPFINMSSDPAQEYFSDGIAEELLNQLAQSPDLMVAARTSAFQFKDKNLDVADIGRKLNVAHVLEGSVRKDGARLRITAQLIKTATGFHVWSQTFERDAADVFKVQDEISTAIAKALRRS
jgi:TolB-like protein